ncbi:MAG: helix-turn-helix domain-containing protein [Oscillospiraceae bacterium]
MDGFRNERLFVVPSDFLQTMLDDPLFSMLYVTDIGYFPSALHHYLKRPQGCPTWLIIYCNDGEGSIQVGGGKPFSLGIGQVAFLPPNTPHEYRASSENPWSIYWVHVSGFQTLKALVPDHLRGALNLQAAGCELLESLFAECFEIMKNKYTFDNYFYLSQIVSHMLASITHYVTDVGSNSRGETAVRDIIHYMKENLHRNLTLTELARKTPYSASSLQLLFRRYTQSSPIDYFLRMKIQAASKEIYFTSRPVKDIALAYGYRDPLYFSRVFKQIMGLSPREYRNQVRG